MRKVKYFVLVMFAMLALNGCSDGGSSSDSSSPSTLTGQFIDAPVKGLKYVCSSGASGVTNDKGEYTCNVGSNVTFYIGSLSIGTVAAQVKPVTPYSLFPNDYTAAVNLARLLQSIDADASYALIIDLNASLAVLVPADINFTDPEFETDIQTALGITLRTAADAKQTMDDALMALGITPALISLSVVENQDDGFTVITADANTLTYSLSGTDAASFDINASTGVVTFKTAPDYETKVTYTFAVTASDGSLSETQDVTITVANVVETPPVLAPFSASISEDASVGTVVGTITATAEGSSITAFTLSDATNFAVSAAGEITTVTTLDFETTSSYALTVFATNTEGNSSNESVTISVIRVPESAPAPDQNDAGQLDLPPAPPAL